MVVVLEKTEHNADFHQIVDFLEASHIRYALLVRPTVYVSHIRHFWSTARIETTDGETKIIAKIDGKQMTIFESSIRRHLKLNDEEGISTLPDEELFENPTLMGYNISPNQRFSFQKADETASSTRDVRHGEAFPTATSLDAGQDRENIAKTSAMPHKSSPKPAKATHSHGRKDPELRDVRHGFVYRGKATSTRGYTRIVNKLLNDVQIISEEQAEYINSPSWNRPAIYYDDDDDKESSILLKDIIISGLPPCVAITSVLLIEEPVDSLIMEDEHIDTILATKSDEVIKSSVEGLVLIPSESEGIPDKMCDVPLCDHPTPLEASKDH
ncbi:hypothetical protein Tco_1335038 [Tanacetum coccineum]